MQGIYPPCGGAASKFRHLFKRILPINGKHRSPIRAGGWLRCNDCRIFVLNDNKAAMVELQVFCHWQSFVVCSILVPARGGRCTAPSKVSQLDRLHRELEGNRKRLRREASASPHSPAPLECAALRRSSRTALPIYPVRRSSGGSFERPACGLGPSRKGGAEFELPAESSGGDRRCLPNMASSPFWEGHPDGTHGTSLLDSEGLLLASITSRIFAAIESGAISSRQWEDACVV